LDTRKSFSEFAQFEFNRINKRRIRRAGSIKTIPNLSMQVVDEGSILTLEFSDQRTKQSMSFPVPYCDQAGSIVVGVEVVRSVGSWFLVGADKELSYWSLMKYIFAERIDHYFPGLPGVGKRSQVEKIMVSFEYNRAHRAVNNLQRVVNHVVNKLPICDTTMQTWAMNNRVVFLDPTFDDLTPEELLSYQKQKNLDFFPWTTVGLSDSTMVKNYMSKRDIREFTPFGKKHHSPMRNLYQSLGMKGPETPLIRTRSTAALEKAGVARGCWNWFTAFIDLPLNFEDQLMVNAKHQDKVNTSEKRFLAFGTVLVKEGEAIESKQTLAIEPGDKHLLFRCSCRSAVVKSIEAKKLPIGGETVDCTLIVINIDRKFKNGFKFTNLHGNKGIAVFCETGTAYDPIRKEYRDIDVMVAAKTVGKRRNFGQIFEALATMLSGPDKHLTIDNDFFADVSKIKTRMAKEGMPEDGTCELETKHTGSGRARAICGWVAWGLLKEPEDSLWGRTEVSKYNAVGIRERGNKVSHIEFRALNTIFGAGNAITKEILSYQEGTDIVKEFTKIVESSIGIFRKAPCVSWEAFSVPTLAKNFLRTRDFFDKTVSNEGCYKDGVYIQLPVDYYTFVPKKFGEDIKNVSVPLGARPPVFDEGDVYKTDKMYIPFSELRVPWQHRCGLWGTSEVSEHINNVLRVLHEVKEGSGVLFDVTLMLRRFFLAASRKLSTKRGLIATHCLAVRYPNSAKATASVSNKLPPNTVEIPQHMANDLGVKEYEYVLIERFPCLGFMSMRVQQVRITDDPNKEFVISVSGSSLNSTGLDFDGDTLHILSFRTPEAKTELEYEFRFPNKTTSSFTNAASNNKVPRVWEASLDSFISMSLNNGMPPMTFSDVSPNTQAAVAESLASIKTGTGTSVALGYNLCRISERAFGYDDTELSAGVEIMLDTTANSVFQNKHRVTALLERK